jgi:hypothetical protein
VCVVANLAANSAPKAAAHFHRNISAADIVGGFSASRPTSRRFGDASR